MTHYITVRDYKIITAGKTEAHPGYKVKCSCGWQAPTLDSQWFLTMEQVNDARRQHERQNAKERL